MTVRRNPVGRVLDALAVFADAGPMRAWGVREFASHMDIPGSAAHRVLTDLEEAGWMERNEGGAYVLSNEAFRIGLALSSEFPMRRLALPLMHELVDKCGEMALLGVFDRTRLQMSFVAQVDAPHPLRYALDLNRWGPIHAGATGLAIMAHLPPDYLDRVIERHGLPAITSRTITSESDLKSELALIRERGFALTQGQRITGSVGIAAPIFGPDGVVAGDLAVTIPGERFANMDGADAVAATIKEYAARISELLRGSGPANTRKKA